MTNNKILQNKIINKITYKILTLFIFSKKKRHKIKEQFFNIYAGNQVQKINSEYKDYWIFTLFFPWGDLGIPCSLMKEFKRKYGGKILVLVNDENRAQVAKLFPSIDEVMTVNKDIYNYIYRNPNFEIKKGNYFEINHWKFYNAPRYQSENFLELYARMMNLDNWSNIESPIFPEEIKNSVSQKIIQMGINIDKTIFISKDSNSFNSKLLSEDFWLKKAEEYKKQGYEIVFNSNQKEYHGYKTIFLPMAEQLYFCSLCKKVLAIRSGFNDLLGIMKLENLEIYYPETMYFSTISPIEQLVEFKRAFKDEPDKTFDENMYRITSMKMYQLNKVEEKIC